MSVLALGLNHQTAPLDLRARFAIPAERLAASLAALRRHLGGAASETALLSTCNRTELYVAADDEQAAPAAFDWLAAQAQVPQRQLQAHAYLRAGDAAARHAFRVASGLDSMVLGEPQILGQLKQAARVAADAGALGQTLHQLFQRSFSVAKAVRSSTEIGHCAVSYASVAAQLAQELFGELGTLRVLCVGAGEMMASVAAHLHGRGAGTLVLANRDMARGAALAARFGGAQALALAAMPARLHEFDIVVSCTASTLPLIGLGAVERALKARRQRPMLLVDLALPRDIEPEVARLPDAYLYTLDDLAQRVQQGGERRRLAVQRAEQLVEAGVRDFGRWLDQRGNVPLIQALQRQAEGWQAAELARARRRLARGESVDEVLLGFAQGLRNKLMHGSLCELRRGDPAVQAAIERLFLHS